MGLRHHGVGTAVMKVDPGCLKPGCIYTLLFSALPVIVIVVVPVLLQLRLIRVTDSPFGLSSASFSLLPQIIEQCFFED